MYDYRVDGLTWGEHKKAIEAQVSVRGAASPTRGLKSVADLLIVHAHKVREMLDALGDIYLRRLLERVELFVCERLYIFDLLAARAVDLKVLIYPIRVLGHKSVYTLLLHFFRRSDCDLAVLYLQGDRLSVAPYENIIYFFHF